MSLNHKVEINILKEKLQRYTDIKTKYMYQMLYAHSQKIDISQFNLDKTIDEIEESICNIKQEIMIFENK
jgi:hypothetical protein